MGRPPGKRSNPDYTLFSVHVRKTTHRDVKLALLMQDDPPELGELVEQLLVEWLARSKKKR